MLHMFLLVIVMALVTYIIRVIPFAVFRKKIKSQYIQSILYYIPYAVLSAMTFPFIFFSTGNVYTALVGTIVAVILAFTNRSLLTVAIFSSVSVFLMQLILGLV